METNVNINIYWQAQEGGSIGKMIDGIMESIGQQGKEVNLGAETTDWGWTTEYEDSVCVEEEITWGYDPQMDPDYILAEELERRDQRTELQKVLDDLSVARQMIGESQCEDPEFQMLRNNLMRDAVRRSYERLEKLVQEEQNVGVGNED